MESELQLQDGSLNQVKVQWAIRQISDEDFYRILSRGLIADHHILPRIEDENEGSMGFKDAKSEFDFDFIRDRIETKVNRLVRDRVFRSLVTDACQPTCALTGLKLINGGGRVEVEAAHIKPLASKGPDIITN